MPSWKCNLFRSRQAPRGRDGRSWATRRIAALAVLLSLSTLAGKAVADPMEAVNFDGTGATNDGPFGGYVLGWEFTVNSPITLQSLGWFDDGSGLSVSHPVGIFYVPSGALVGSVIVEPTDPLVSSVAPQPGAGFRYHALDSPFGLDVGTYRIGGLNPAGSTDKNYDFVQNVTSSLGVTFVHSYYSPSTTLVAPTAFGDREKGYFGPNFLFTDGAGPPPPPPPPPPPTQPPQPPVDLFPAISVNIASTFGIGGPPPAEVGANVAGYIPSNNWNEIPVEQQTNTPLKTNSGAVVPGLTLTTGETFVYPGSVYNSGATFTSGPGDSALMRGHFYHGAPNPVDVRIDGTIPYENYDVYVYFNSGGVSNTQSFSLLASDLSDLGLLKKVFESPGPDTAFVYAYDTTINANYVKFTNLNNLDLPSFVLRAQAEAGYGYINGLQIVKILLGDANSDGTADFTDLGILLNNYDKPGEFGAGDFDNSATVEFSDLGILLNNYNQTVAASTIAAFPNSASVPEPSSIVLAALGFAGLVVGARRRVKLAREIS